MYSLSRSIIKRPKTFLSCKQKVDVTTPLKKTRRSTIVNSGSVPQYQIASRNASINCRRFVSCSWAIRVNHAAENLCRVAILNPFQESYLQSFEERLLIPYERAETNHDNVAFQKQLPSEMSIYIDLHIVCINFQVVFVGITSENVRSLTQFMKKYLRIKAGVFFKRNPFVREDAAFRFVILFVFVLI